jgi:hypothetical protein
MMKASGRMTNCETAGKEAVGNSDRRHAWSQDVVR